MMASSVDIKPNRATRPARIDAQAGPWSVSVAEASPGSWTIYIKTPTHLLTLTRTAHEIAELHLKLQDQVPARMVLPPCPLEDDQLQKRKSSFLTTLLRLASPPSQANPQLISAHKQQDEITDPFLSVEPSATSALASYLTSLSNDGNVRVTRSWKRFVRVRTDDLESTRVERAIKRVRSDLAMLGGTNVPLITTEPGSARASNASADNPPPTGHESVTEWNEDTERNHSPLGVQPVVPETASTDENARQPIACGVVGFTDFTTAPIPEALPVVIRSPPPRTVESTTEPASAMGTSIPRERREKAEEGICIVSFDGGGPGSMSQLRMLDEIMLRLAFELGIRVDELRPADYFDLMGGVGFGGLAALLLGRLRMTTSQAMEELATVGTEVFPKDDDMVTPEVNMARLRKAIESMLERYGHCADISLRDSSNNQCKVVLFAATSVVMDHCQPFRTYPSPRKCLESTFVDAACATMATPEYFSPVAIGPRLRQQLFAGIPHGFHNPMREVLKEAQLIFGEMNPVSLVLSLGSGQRARLSDLDHHVTRLSRIHCDGVARDLQHQLRGFGEYLRLNVDRGMENVELEDWHELGSIEAYTNVYLEMNQITKYIDKAFQWLLQRNGSVTLGLLNGTNGDRVVKFHSETLKDYLAMEFKQMQDVVQQLGIERITLVDAIGNHIPIPTGFCLTYNMLLDVIGVYFRHQKAPGSDFVERGDYRLVHGNRRNVVDPVEWTRVEKVGLKVEMSMILRTRNEDKARCPGCRAWFEGRATDGWAQCLSCSGQFQIETQVQARSQVLSDDVNRRGEDHRIEPSVSTPTVRESKSNETGTLQFRLISVINLMEPHSISTPGPTISELLKANLLARVGLKTKPPRRERSGIAALDRDLNDVIDEHDEMAIDPEDDDWDFQEAPGDHEDYNGQRVKSLFARGVVDRYRLKVFRKPSGTTPAKTSQRYASSSTNGSLMLDSELDKLPDPVSPSSSGKGRKGGGGLSLRKGGTFLRPKSPPATYPARSSRLGTPDLLTQHSVTISGSSNSIPLTPSTSTLSMPVNGITSLKSQLSVDSVGSLGDDTSVNPTYASVAPWS